MLAQNRTARGRVCATLNMDVIRVGEWQDRDVLVSLLVGDVVSKLRSSSAAVLSGLTVCLQVL